MSWKFWETRSSGSGSSDYSERAVALALAQAAGTATVGRSELTGAIEIGAGLWGRGLAAARVDGDAFAASVLTPDVLASMGRQLARVGEAVWDIRVSRSGGIELLQAQSWDIRGGASPASWSYRLDLGSPSDPESVMRPAAGVIHARYATLPGEPHRGLGPLQLAPETARLLSAMEVRLADDVSTATGYLLPAPLQVPDDESDDDGDTHAALRADLRSLKGGTAPVESMSAGWGEGKPYQPPGDWEAKRIGADPPAALIGLRSDVQMTVLAVLGVPVELVTASDGTGQREAWRRFLFSTIRPIALTLETELRDKLDAPSMSLDFDQLAASDIAGRARAYASLVNAQMPPEQAARIAGVSES